MVRSGGFCCNPRCSMELDFLGINGPRSANTPVLSRINASLNHTGYEGAPGTNNIKGWSCRKCGNSDARLWA